ncbi:hypothetical protein LCGC14_0914050 [marine sediment metagenome]|uniref:Methyltransferase type 11 domain-containing protein n=1 Tax=marine sediment metagenome TaxID=412755 RepID=A0A0F9NSN6_9ZZZZ
MTTKYIVTQDDVDKDREDFYNKYPGNTGQVDRVPAIDLTVITKRWAQMLETQNGEDFDDYLMNPSTIERYVDPWVEKPALILAMGVGTGREIIAAREAGYNCFGTTLGKKNPTFAEWKWKLSKKDLFYGEHCTLPYASGQFDAIVGFQLFEHCHAPYMFLFECARVLKPGGQLILEWPPYITTNNGTLEIGEDPAPSNFMFDYDDDNLHHACCWTPAQGNIMVRRCGFADLEVYLSNYLSQEVSVPTTGPVPDRLMRIDDKDPAWYSNISPSDIVLRARRRPDDRMPGDVRKLIEAGQ